MNGETKVQKKIIDFLKSIPNLEYERRQAGGFSYRKGRPDLWFVYKGRHYEVEVKDVGGQPGSMQLISEQKFRDAGAVYWRGETFMDFLEWFNNSVI